MFGILTTNYWYDADGGTADRTFSQNGIQYAEDHFRYSWRELTRQYILGAPGSPQRTDWRYRYNPSGGREQKRQYFTPNGDVGGNGYQWTYYLLGGTKEQLAVWGGYQTRDWLCGEAPNQNGYVYLYPQEYLTYGPSGTASLITKPTGEKEYRIADHQGSVRVSASLFGGPVETLDYEPFGKLLPQGGAVTGLPRKTYIDRERDAESGLGNFGLRQYDEETGRFLHIDPMWERFPGQTPYNYSENNPVRLSDGNGDCPICPALIPALEYVGYLIGSFVAMKAATELAEQGALSSFPLSYREEFELQTSSGITVRKGYIGSHITIHDSHGDFEILPSWDYEESPVGAIGVAVMMQALLKSEDIDMEGPENPPGDAGSEGTEEINPKDIKILKDKYLKENGIDPHELKREHLGRNAKISEYDIYRHTKTRELIIHKKKGKGSPIHTGEYID